MNGFIKRYGAVGRTLLSGGLAAGLVAVAGCSYSYEELVDPCWPQRYNAIAREEVREPIVTQADNGLYLEQTIWNHHFKKGEGGRSTADLTDGAKALLDRLARRRPSPVLDVFVQTAHDVEYVAGKPDQFSAEQNDLDNRRMKAVKDYLAAVRPDAAFRMAVHDPSPVGMHAMEASTAVNRVLTGAARGTLQTESEETRKAENTQREQKEESKEVRQQGSSEERRP